MGGEFRAAGEPAHCGYRGSIVTVSYRDYDDSMLAAPKSSEYKGLKESLKLEEDEKVKSQNQCSFEW